MEILIASLMIVATTSLIVLAKTFKKSNKLFLLLFVPFLLFTTVSTYVTIENVKGFPVIGKPKTGFILNWYIIGEKYIYLWVTEVNENTPRVYALLYDKKITKKLKEFRNTLKEGRGKIKGKFFNFNTENEDFDLRELKPKDVTPKNELRDRQKRENNPGTEKKFKDMTLKDLRGSKKL